MESIFQSIYFLYFVIPLVAVVLSVFLKMVSRNDRYVFFKKEDLAIGLELSLASLIIYLTYCTTIASNIAKNSNPQVSDTMKGKLMEAPWIILAMVVGMWGVSTIIRKVGWKSENEMSWFWGVILPFVYGVICLYIAVNRMS